ncbi:DinB family protein [Halobacillus sp. A5]|uniref:DinB family protein n=1 Tax=Halobacillus sp. A5 TaxID=2880263 RepID=UPI0020A65EFC|nr:DinB family protein [Halobacillus sp. A5]MCP3027145.1 hypothetical protein [Halobacillus sp. A5]
MAVVNGTLSVGQGVFLLILKFAAQFLDEYEEAPETKIKGTVSWQENEIELSVLWLMTHTITHEFHHKGQIVSIARRLGYEPVDTDLVLP